MVELGSFLSVELTDPMRVITPSITDSIVLGPCLPYGYNATLL